MTVAFLLVVGNKRFGVSSSFRHVCAAVLPKKPAYLHYNWGEEAWNLYFVAGIILGAFLASWWIPNPESVAISGQTARDLTELGITDQVGLVPSQIFSWQNLLSPTGILFVVVGGFLVGFGTRYADGCTSGHSIMGLANLEKSSLLATLSFFAGGLLVSWLIIPVVL